ncbi:MAG: methyltransferase domain-containing protein [Blastocatellia bacterium]|nr:methyltransferase domain-containing protein [Blastocatellia bacterium]
MPRPLFRWLKTRLRGPEETPGVGEVDLGDLRRVTPISSRWGYERGRPVDRYYIERFLSDRSEDIQGRVLEIADNAYTVKYGGERVTTSEVLHAEEGNPSATIVGDLAAGDNIPSDAFECIILTQTLLLIYDVPAAIRTVHRILKPGGVVLVTVPGVSHKITRYDMDRWGDYWRFTSLSIRRLFEEVFPAENLEVEAHGNVLTAAAFLYGLGAEEITEEEFAYDDPDFEVSIALRAVKPGRRV